MTHPDRLVSDTMAEKAPTPDEKEEIDAQTENASKEGGIGSKLALLKRFRPFLIVSTIVMAECVVAFFLAPSGTPVYADSKELSPEQLLAIQKSGVIQEKKEEEQIHCIEIDMGEFSITYSSKSQGGTTQVDFNLFGVVPDDKEGGFSLLFDEKKNRIRDLIRSTIRESEISELTNPGLALIKRQILEKVNRELGKPMLQDVVFSDYSLLEH